MVVPGRKRVCSRKSLAEIACRVAVVPWWRIGQFVQHFHINLWSKYLNRVFSRKHAGKLDVIYEVTERDLVGKTRC